MNVITHARAPLGCTQTSIVHETLEHVQRVTAVTPVPRRVLGRRRVGVVLVQRSLYRERRDESSWRRARAGKLSRY